MWPDGDPPKAAEHSTRTYLSRLRAVLADGAITTQRAGYALLTDSVDIDVDRFDSLIAAAESAVPDRAVVLYDEALGMWRGDPFGELTCEWWALPESSRLQVMRTSAELGQRGRPDRARSPPSGHCRLGAPDARASARRASRDVADKCLATDRTLC